MTALVTALAFAAGLGLGVGGVALYAYRRASARIDRLMDLMDDLAEQETRLQARLAEFKTNHNEE